MTAVTDDILRRVQAIVAAVAGEQRVPPDAGADTPLGEDGYWLDSVDILEVILACEDQFAARLDQDPDLTTGALGSARRLADLIRRKIG